MSPVRRLVLPVVLIAVLAPAACGGDGTTTASPTASTGAGDGAGQGFRDGEDFRKIQECLAAAGITLPTPSLRGTPPSGGPDRTPPSGVPGGGAPGGPGMFSDPDVQAALKACGMTVPTGRPRPSSTPSATA
jgi:hypothetical protein